MVQQELIANNLANVSTGGYKRARTTNTQFDEILLANIKSGRPGIEVIGPLSRGVRISEAFVDFSPGIMTETGEPMDLAIDGDGFFTVIKDGRLCYTRNGRFKIGPGGYIMTESGGYLMGRRGPLRVDSGTLVVTEDGKIYLRRPGSATGDDLAGQGEFLDELWLVDFEDRRALSRLGDSLFEYTGTQRIDLWDQPSSVTVRQGVIERSNVDIVREMVDMIACFRAYESAQKVLTAQDDTLEKLVNQVGRVG
jgi:flagellar basal-body rod protein FlgG